MATPLPLLLPLLLPDWLWLGLLFTCPLPMDAFLPAADPRLVPLSSTPPPDDDVRDMVMGRSDVGEGEEVSSRADVRSVSGERGSRGAPDILISGIGARWVWGRAVWCCMVGRLARAR